MDDQKGKLNYEIIRKTRRYWSMFLVYNKGNSNGNLLIEKVDSSGKSPAITLYGNLAPYDVIILIEHDTLIKNKYDK